MTQIRLENGTIKVGENWYTSTELARMIQEKIQNGDMKVAELAAALESLNLALENIQRVEESLVISRDVYEKLLAAGGGDERESIRKAVMAFIGKAQEVIDSNKGLEDEQMRVVSVPRIIGKKTMIKCAECAKPIEVTSAERPIVMVCPHCGTHCRLTL